MQIKRTQLADTFDNFQNMCLEKYELNHARLLLHLD